MAMGSQFSQLLRALLLLLSCLPIAATQYHSHSLAALHTMNLDANFRSTTARNHQIITQAIELVQSMQNAPTCTRMAASHLMKECKLLEHAPDFVRTQPAAYLDNVKTEYAAKLAVCELMSAQTSNPVPPQGCGILVPSVVACDKDRRWWQSRSEQDERQICYPEFREPEYSRCLRALQSSPQYWTSFSNARQNAVVMCQASRDAIERENHLDIFKNLTKVVEIVSNTLKASADEYEVLFQERKTLIEDLRSAQHDLKEGIISTQNEALAYIKHTDQRLRVLLEDSMTEFVTSLASSQTIEVSRIQQHLESFSGDMTNELLRSGSRIQAELQEHHEWALSSLNASQKAHMESFTILSAQLEVVKNTAIDINAVSNSSMERMATIEKRLVGLTDHVEQLVNSVTVLGILPQLLTSLARGFLGVLALVFLSMVLIRPGRWCAIYALGGMSLIVLARTLGMNGWVEMIRFCFSQTGSEPLSMTTRHSSTSQDVTLFALLACTGAYVLSRVLIILRLPVGAGMDQVFAPFWIGTYANDIDMGLLPNVEIPRTK